MVKKLLDFTNPFNNVIGFALPATKNPKVALTLPAANEHRILFFSKSSSTDVSVENIFIIDGNELIFLLTEPFTSFSFGPFLQKSKSHSSKDITLLKK